MPTAEEIRTEWKAIRSALGNVICYIEGKTTQLAEAEQSWNKGYDCGYADGVKSGYDASTEDYKKGFEDCWEIARRIVKMDVHKLAMVFFPNAVAVTHDEPFTKYNVHEAIQLLKEYDSAQSKVEVVRCGECKYSDTFPEVADSSMPLKCLNIRYGGVYPDWYCEHGQRREDGDA